MRTEFEYPEFPWEQVRKLPWKGWVLLFGVCILIGTSPLQLGTVVGFLLVFFPHIFSSPSFSEGLFVPWFSSFLSFTMSGWDSVTANCGIWMSCDCRLPDTSNLAGWDAKQHLPWEGEYLLAAGKMLYVFQRPLPDLLGGLTFSSRPQESIFQACQTQSTIPASLSFYVTQPDSPAKYHVNQVAVWVSSSFISSPVYLIKSGRE